MFISLASVWILHSQYIHTQNTLLQKELPKHSVHTGFKGQTRRVRRPMGDTTPVQLELTVLKLIFLYLQHQDGSAGTLRTHSIIILDKATSRTLD